MLANFEETVFIRLVAMADWIQRSDETPECCGHPAIFYGQLGLAWREVRLGRQRTDLRFPLPQMLEGARRFSVFMTTWANHTLQWTGPALWVLVKWSPSARCRPFNVGPLFDPCLPPLDKDERYVIAYLLCSDRSSRRGCGVGWSQSF